MQDNQILIRVSGKLSRTAFGLILVAPDGRTLAVKMDKNTLNKPNLGMDEILGVTLTGALKFKQSKRPKDDTPFIQVKECKY